MLKIISENIFFSAKKVPLIKLQSLQAQHSSVVSFTAPQSSVLLHIYSTPSGTTGSPIPFLFMACPDHYQDPCNESRPAFLHNPLAVVPYSALVWPPGIWAGEAQTLHQNVNPCSNDIVNPNECYSNWLMGNSHPVLKGARSKQSHLPGRQVFLTGSWLLPIGASSYSALWS